MAARSACPMKRHYRCYFLGTDGRIKDVIEFASADDANAILQARASFDRQSEFVGFELWEGARRVLQMRPKRPPS
jgi:hypothetical protein